MEIPTLKVGEYRGVKVYVRKVGRETFEYLVPMEGQLYCNQVEIARKIGERFHPWTEADTNSAIGFMLDAAQNFIDDRLFQKELYDSWPERWKRWKGRITGYAFHIRYKLSIFIDNLHEGKTIRGAGSGHGRAAERENEIVR